MTRAIRLRLVVVALIVIAIRVGTAGRPQHVVPPAAPLTAFPLDLSGWQGVDGPAFDEATLAVLGADQYLNRIYINPIDRSAVGLYIGHYGKQQQGDSIHSPQNCLPGNGWQPVSHSRPLLAARDGTFAVNRYVVERRGDRQVVLYWYHGRGRAVANEYANKAYLLFDALRLGRTDGALVRIIAPVVEGEDAADSAARTFAGAMLPALSRWLP